MPSHAWYVARLIRYQPVWYGLASVGWILYHSWPLLPGLLAKLFFDRLPAGALAGPNLATLAALICVAGAGRAGAAVGGSVAWAAYTFRTGAWLRRNLLARILERPGARPVPGTVGEAISTLRDDVSDALNVAGLLYDTAAAACFAVGGLVILLRVDALVTLLVFGPLVAVITVAHAVRARLVRVREESRAATARVTGAIGEIFASAQAIQVAGAEARVAAHLARLNGQRERAALRDRWQSLWLDAVFQSAAGLGAGLVLLVAAGRMRSGAFSVGDFAIFSSYLMEVVSFTGFVGYLIGAYRQTRVNFSRMAALLQGAPAEGLVAPQPLRLAGEEPAPTVTPRRPEPLERLEVRGLTCLHPESGRGIRDVSFTLRRGSLTVVTGRVGSGKTTLLRALLGLLETQGGEVRWNGVPVTEPARFFLPPRAAYTAQVPALLSGTLRENILLGEPADAGRLGRAVHQAALERDLALFPDGLETEVGVRGLKLSGGQIQRTAEARMFVREPELLVFDDLSSALDVETERLLWERALGQGATCLVVSHRPAVLSRADQIIVLDDGRVVDRVEAV
jgi:ATP-binding cassette subfamily B protein